MIITKRLIELDKEGNIKKIGFIQSGTLGELRKAWNWNQPSKALDKDGI